MNYMCDVVSNAQPTLVLSITVVAVASLSTYTNLRRLYEFVSRIVFAPREYVLDMYIYDEVDRLIYVGQLA